METDAPQNGKVGGGALERLRQRRAEVAAQATLDLVLPFDDQFGVRYHVLPEDMLQDFIGKAQRAGHGEAAEYDVDLVIAATECLLARNEAGDLEPLTDETGRPLKFEPELAAALEVDAQTARQTATAFFSPQDRFPLALSGHANALLSWMRGRGKEIDLELLGK